MGGLVLSLLAEKIGDGGWVFIQVNSLGPTAVDVIHHALERPQACEKSEAVIVGEYPALRGVQDGVHRRDARVPLTLFEQFVGECCTEIVGQWSHPDCFRSSYPRCSLARRQQTLVTFFRYRRELGCDQRPAIAVVLAAKNFTAGGAAEDRAVAVRFF